MSGMSLMVKGRWQVSHSQIQPWLRGIHGKNSKRNSPSAMLPTIRGMYLDVERNGESNKITNAVGSKKRNDKLGDLLIICPCAEKPTRFERIFKMDPSLSFYSLSNLTPESNLVHRLLLLWPQGLLSHICLYISIPGSLSTPVLTC